MPTSNDSTPDGPRRAPAKLPRGGPSAADKGRLRAVLLAMRAQLLRSNQDLADEALKTSGQNFSLDHLADHGSDNFEQDISLSLLEGETEILDAIEAAIHKIDANRPLPYGLCEECADADAWEAPAPWIPVGRLEAVPYARLCVAHQEAQEEE